MKQSGHGFVLISVLVMLSLLSFWLTMGMEISGLELKMSQRFFMGAQTDSIGRLGFDKAVIRLPLDVNVCQMKVPLSYEQLENLSVGFWTQYGCKGEMYGRHYSSGSKEIDKRG